MINPKSALEGLIASEMSQIFGGFCDVVVFVVVALEGLTTGEMSRRFVFFGDIVVVLVVTVVVADVIVGSRGSPTSTRSSNCARRYVFVRAGS